jgi:putative zinc finger protein
MSHTESHLPNCEAIAELLPWHANGTLGAVDRANVDAHVAACYACRTTLAVERRIVEAIRAPRDNVEQSPHAGWQKLAARIDGEVTAEHAVEPAGGSLEGANPDSAEPVSIASHAVARRRINWPAVLGLAVAVQAAAIAVLAIALVRHRQAELLAPNYRVTANADPTLAANGPLVRIAFDRSVDEGAARTVAQAVSGRILAGPSPDNVYTFEFRPGSAAARAVDEKVSWLRRQAHVQLVEPVVLGPRPAAKP